MQYKINNYTIAVYQIVINSSIDKHKIAMATLHNIHYIPMTDITQKVGIFKF